MAIEFEVQLGKGWYMDSTGRLHRAPAPNVAIYKVGDTFPGFDLAKVSDALDKFASAMPDSKNADSIKKFRDAGMPEGTIKLLAALGTVASAASVVGAVYAAFIAFAYMAGAFKEGPSAAEIAIEQAAAELRSFSRSVAEQLRSQFVVDLKANITVSLNAAKAFADEMQVYKPDPARLELRMQELRDIERIAATAALKATDWMSWLQEFDWNDYSWTWLLNVYAHPEASSGPVLAELVPQGSRRFDHRLAMPFGVYATQSYLTVIKGIASEYRTTGQFRDNLRSLAVQTSAMAAAMRAQGLARTLHTGRDFVFGARSGSGAISPRFDVATNVIFVDYTVGAIDLCQYTDAYLSRIPITYEEVEAARKCIAPIQRGHMKMAWQPKMHDELAADLPTGTPDQEAEKANAISERLYAELLVSSGYLQLVHQAALLRHLCTEPDRSETVEPRKTTYGSDPQGSQWITISSGKIPFSEPVTSEAHREVQHFRARTLLSTQPLGRQRAVPYRIWLRSVQLEQLAPTEVLDPEYESVYRTRYVPEGADPSFNRLAVMFERSMLRDEVLLFEGTTPADEINREGVATIKADTFDWYLPVPVLARPAPASSIESVAARLARLGWSEEMARPPEVSGLVHAIDIGASSVQFGAAGVLSAGWKAAKSAVRGERRNLRQESCIISWRASWVGNRLSVILEGRAEDRNCALFLVIEEALISGQFLHTAVPIAMNTQLTTVPQSFLDAEQAAWARAFGVIAEVGKRGAAAAAGTEGPGRVIDGVPVSRFVQQFGVAALADRYMQIAPQLVGRVLAEFSQPKGRSRKR